MTLRRIFPSKIRDVTSQETSTSFVISWQRLKCEYVSYNVEVRCNNKLLDKTHNKDDCSYELDLNNPAYQPGSYEFKVWAVSRNGSLPGQACIHKLYIGGKVKDVKAELVQNKAVVTWKYLLKKKFIIQVKEDDSIVHEEIVSETRFQWCCRLSCRYEFSVKVENATESVWSNFVRTDEKVKDVKVKLEDNELEDIFTPSKICNVTSQETSTSYVISWPRLENEDVYYNVTVRYNDELLDEVHNEDDCFYKLDLNNPSYQPGSYEFKVWAVLRNGGLPGATCGHTLYIGEKVEDVKAKLVKNKAIVTWKYMLKKKFFIQVIEDGSIVYEEILSEARFECCCRPSHRYEFIVKVEKETEIVWSNFFHTAPSKICNVTSQETATSYVISWPRLENEDVYYNVTVRCNDELLDEVHNEDDCFYKLDLNNPAYQPGSYEFKVWAVSRNGGLPGAACGHTTNIHKSTDTREKVKDVRAKLVKNKAIVTWKYMLEKKFIIQVKKGGSIVHEETVSEARFEWFCRPSHQYEFSVKVENATESVWSNFVRTAPSRISNVTSQVTPTTTYIISWPKLEYEDVFYKTIVHCNNELLDVIYEKSGCSYELDLNNPAYQPGSYEFKVSAVSRNGGLLGEACVHKLYVDEKVKDLKAELEDNEAIITWKYLLKKKFIIQVKEDDSIIHEETVSKTRFQWCCRPSHRYEFSVKVENTTESVWSNFVRTAPSKICNITSQETSTSYVISWPRLENEDVYYNVTVRCNDELFDEDYNKDDCSYILDFNNPAYQLGSYEAEVWAVSKNGGFHGEACVHKLYIAPSKISDVTSQETSTSYVISWPRLENEDVFYNVSVHCNNKLFDEVCIEEDCSYELEFNNPAYQPGSYEFQVCAVSRHGELYGEACIHKLYIDEKVRDVKAELEDNEAIVTWKYLLKKVFIIQVIEDGSIVHEEIVSKTRFEWCCRPSHRYEFNVKVEKETEMVWSNIFYTAPSKICNITSQETSTSYVISWPSLKNEDVYYNVNVRCNNKLLDEVHNKDDCSYELDFNNRACQPGSYEFKVWAASRNGGFFGEACVHKLYKAPSKISDVTSQETSTSYVISWPRLENEDVYYNVTVRCNDELLDKTHNKDDCSYELEFNNPAYQPGSYEFQVCAVSRHGELFGEACVHSLYIDEKVRDVKVELEDNETIVTWKYLLKKKFIIQVKEDGSIVHEEIVSKTRFQWCCRPSHSYEFSVKVEKETETVWSNFFHTAPSGISNVTSQETSTSYVIFWPSLENEDVYYNVTVRCNDELLHEVHKQDYCFYKLDFNDPAYQPGLYEFKVWAVSRNEGLPGATCGHTLYIGEKVKDVKAKLENNKAIVTWKYMLKKVFIIQVKKDGSIVHEEIISKTRFEWCCCPSHRYEFSVKVENATESACSNFVCTAPSKISDVTSQETSTLYVISWPRLENEDVYYNVTVHCNDELLDKTHNKDDCFYELDFNNPAYQPGSYEFKVWAVSKKGRLHGPACIHKLYIGEKVRDVEAKLENNKAIVTWKYLLKKDFIIQVKEDGSIVHEKIVSETKLECCCRPSHRYEFSVKVENETESVWSDFVCTAPSTISDVTSQETLTSYVISWPKLKNEDVYYNVTVHCNDELLDKVHNKYDCSYKLDFYNPAYQPGSYEFKVWAVSKKGRLHGQACIHTLYIGEKVRDVKAKLENNKAIVTWKYLLKKNFIIQVKEDGNIVHEEIVSETKLECCCCPSHRYEFSVKVENATESIWSNVVCTDDFNTASLPENKSLVSEMSMIYALLQCNETIMALGVLEGTITMLEDAIQSEIRNGFTKCMPNAQRTTVDCKKNLVIILAGKDFNVQPSNGCIIDSTTIAREKCFTRTFSINLKTVRSCVTNLVCCITQDKQDIDRFSFTPEIDSLIPQGSTINHIHTNIALLNSTANDVSASGNNLTIDGTRTTELPKTSEKMTKDTLNIPNGTVNNVTGVAAAVGSTLNNQTVSGGSVTIGKQ